MFVPFRHKVCSLHLEVQRDCSEQAYTALRGILRRTLASGAIANYERTGNYAQLGKDKERS
jgi:hypothetical protein